MRGGSTLLVFDFDGTLAEIRERPSDVHLGRAATALLAEAAHLEGVVVAVVSGRDADDLATRVPLPGIYLIASHGLEIRGPGGIVIRDAPPLETDLGSNLEQEIDRSGLRLERKKHGVALHWRGAPYEAIAPIVEDFREWARGRALEVIEGRSVIEARRSGAGKEASLRWLAHAAGAGRVIYAGDDLTDFDSLAFAAARGRALFVASSEREPPPGVTVVGSFRELFRIVREEVMI